jgi:hypothetical protein
MVRAVNELGFKPKMIGGAMVGLQSTAIKARLGPLLNGNGRSSLPTVSSYTRPETQTPPASLKPLQTSGDIHAVPEEVVILHHDITLMHSNPKSDAMVRCDFLFGFGCRVLHPHSTTHRLHRARILNEDAVASRFDDPAAMFPDDRIEDIPPQLFEAT